MVVLILEPIVRAEDLFSRLNPEEENISDKRLEIEKNPTLERLIETFQLVTISYDIRSMYRNINKLLTFPYMAKDIESFSIAASNFQNTEGFSTNLGIYLSVLINECEDKEILLFTKHLENYPSFLGFGNKYKIITVKGNVRDSAGIYMSGGKIVILGNAGECLGHSMAGGEILVPNPETKVRQYLGMNMRGGIIDVYGFAEGGIGSGMTGGEIHLYGDYISISQNLQGGKIFYHKGNRIREIKGMRKLK